MEMAKMACITHTHTERETETQADRQRQRDHANIQKNALMAIQRTNNITQKNLNGSPGDVYDFMAFSAPLTVGWDFYCLG